MYLATDPDLKIFSSRDPQKQNLSQKCSLKKYIIFKDFHTFSQLFKNSRSTSSQRGTRCRAVSLYICYFSIDKVTIGPHFETLKVPSHYVQYTVFAHQIESAIGSSDTGYGKPQVGQEEQICLLPREMILFFCNFILFWFYLSDCTRGVVNSQIPGTRPSRVRF